MTTQPFKYITNPSDAEQLAKQIMSRSGVVGLDTETTGLDPFTDRVTLLSLTDKHGTYVVDTRDVRCLAAFRDLLEKEAIVKIGVNLSFDYKMIKGTSGIDTEGMVDLMIGEQALTAGLQRDGFGLAALAEKYMGVTLSKEQQLSFVDHFGEFSRDQLEYAAKDTGLLLGMGEKMMHKAKQAGVFHVWQIENRAISSFADMEFYGQKIDAGAWRSLIVENRAAAEAARHDLDDWFKEEYARLDNGLLSLNYNSPTQLLTALRHRGVMVGEELITKTDKKTQKKIKENPIMIALEKYRSGKKRVDTYGLKYLNAIHPYTGRVHFRFKQYGTETGRPACMGGLNCLNIPRDKKYRQAFVTDAGRLISTVDYSGAELRILADLSEEPLMIEGFNSGIDFHCYVASLVFKKEVTKTNENKDLRNPTKTINFGIAYGLGAGSLYEQLNGMNYTVTREEARTIFDEYKATFPVMIKWLQRQQDKAINDLHAVNINGRKRSWRPPSKTLIEKQVRAEVSKKGKIEITEEIYQREIKPEIEDRYKGKCAAIKREGANFHIQSVNADFTKAAMYEIRKEFKRRGWDARMYNSVYDEIVMDMDASIAEEGHELQKEIMVREADKMLKRVPMEVEGKLEPSWTK